MHNVYEDWKENRIIAGYSLGYGSGFDFEAFLKLEQKIEYKKSHRELHMYEQGHIFYTISAGALEREVLPHFV